MCAKDKKSPISQVWDIYPVVVEKRPVTLPLVLSPICSVVGALSRFGWTGDLFLTVKTVYRVPEL
jgi:hypothetical protein